MKQNQLQPKDSVSNHHIQSNVMDGELNQNEKKYLDDLLQNNQSNTMQFFKDKKKSRSDSVVELYLNGSIDKINSELNNGYLQITDKPVTSFVIKSKNQTKLVDIKQKKQLLEKQLGYLYTQMKSYSSNQNEQKTKSPSLLPPQQHKKLIKNLIKKHQEFEELHKKNLQELERKKIQSQQQKKKQQYERIQKEKEDRRKKIIQNLNQIKQSQLKRKLDYQQTNNKVEDVKKTKFLHQIMEQKYEKQVILPTLEQKKKKLRDLRQFKKPLSIQEINNHEQEYLKKKEAHKSAFKKRVIDWKYEPPAKSLRLQKLLQEQQKKKIQQMEQKKRLLQEKLERGESYALYLKENFKPKIDQEKKHEIQERIQRQKENRSKSIEENDPKQIGLQYLDYIKRNNKLRSRETKNNTQRQKSNQQMNISSHSKSNTVKPFNYLPSRGKQQYDEIRNKKVQKIINDKDRNKTQRVKQLRDEAERLNLLANRKDQLLKMNRNQENQEEVTQLLLASIRAKMGIIDIYKS